MAVRAGSNEPARAGHGEHVGRRRFINEARRHAASAAKIGDDDPVLGIGACHDAARKAITAHLRAGGYRVSNAAGAHRTVIEYAEVALPDVVSQDDLNDLDFLRRDRHIAEYGDFASRTITPDRVHDALALANRITNAVAATLAAKNQPSEGPKGSPNKRVR